MNETIALLAASPEAGAAAARVHQMASNLARSVMSRDGRIIVVADAANVLSLAMLAAEFRVSQELETGERRRPPMVLVHQVVGQELEAALLAQQTDENDERHPSLLESLAAFEAIEIVGPRDRREDIEGMIGRLLARESTRAVFLVGDREPLGAAIRGAVAYHRESGVPLYAVGVGDGSPEGWHRVEAASQDSIPTLNGRIIEAGEDREVARAADADAALAVLLEEALDELIEPPPYG